MQCAGGKVLGKNWAQSLYKYTIPKHAILKHTKPCNMLVEKFWVKIGRKAFISNQSGRASAQSAPPIFSEGGPIYPAEANLQTKHISYM